MKLKNFFLALAIAMLPVLVPASSAQAQGYVVIVNSADATSSISKADLSNIFLKKGGKLTPVDQGKGASVRESFSKDVHGRPVAAVQSYWQQQIFSGKNVPPAEKGSDAEVIAFVKANPGSIGYVSSGADLGGGVKAVTVN